MNVLVVTNMYPVPQRVMFGIFVREQVEDLRRLGTDVRVLFFDGTADSRAYLKGMRAVRRLVAEGEVDLVHAHYGLTGLAALAQGRVPVVTTFHGSDASGDVPWQTAISWVVARLGTPIFVAEHLAANLGLPDATVIPAAVDTAVFRPGDRDEARRALGWPRDGVVALLPGSRDDRAKRPDLFAAALEEARALVPGIRGTSLERIPRATVALVMNAVDVTVVTSDFEGSPVAVRESLACETPVVSVPVGDVEAVLEGLPGCAVTSREPAEIARAIVKAVEAGGSNQQRTRAEEYSRPRIAERIMRVYESVLDGARRVRSE